MLSYRLHFVIKCSLTWNHCYPCFLAESAACIYLKMGSHDGEADELPPPPPVPPDVVPIKAEDVVGELPPNKPVKPKRVPMVRPGIGRKGQSIQLYSNHFKVSVKSTEDFFVHYHVCLLAKFAYSNLLLQTLACIVYPLAELIVSFD